MAVAMTRDVVATACVCCYSLLLLQESEAFRLDFRSTTFIQRCHPVCSVAVPGSPPRSRNPATNSDSDVSRKGRTRRTSSWILAASVNADDSGENGATAAPAALVSPDSDRDIGPRNAREIDDSDSPAGIRTPTGQDERSTLEVAEAAMEEDREGGRVALVDRGGVSKDRLAFEELGTREVDRLFSTLEPCDVSGYRHKPGNLLSATALVGGTTVGAGILALPAATLQAGLIPSSVGLIMM